MDWEGFVRRYVWHETRTPHFVAVRRLTRTQARYELFLYTLLCGVLFLVLTLASLAGRLPHGGASVVPIFAFTAFCAALIFGFTRHPWAALYCASGPVAALAYFAAYGFHPNLEGGDRVVLVVLVLGWLAYAVRTVAIARAYPDLREAPDPQ